MLGARAGWHTTLSIGPAVQATNTTSQSGDGRGMARLLGDAGTNTLIPGREWSVVFASPYSLTILGIGESKFLLYKYTTAPVAAMRSRVLGSMPTVNGWTRNAACKEGKPQPVDDVEEALKTHQRGRTPRFGFASE